MRSPRSSALFISLFLIFAVNARTQWVRVKGPTDGSVYCLAVSGANLLAGTDSGVYLSSNRGTTWRAAGLANTPVLSVAVSLNETGGTNLFAGTFRGGILLSTNNGSTWSPVNAGIPRTSYDTAAYCSVTDFAVISNGKGTTNLFAGTAGCGVFTSTNNGTNWGAVNVGFPRSSFDTSGYQSIRTFALSPNGAGGTNLFAGTGDGAPFGGDVSIGGVFLSTNNGTSWSSDGLPFLLNYVHALALFPDGTGGTTLVAGTSLGVFHSVNDGGSWTRDTTGLIGSEVVVFAASPDGAGGTNLFAGTTYGVFLSTDNGARWKPVTAGMPDYFTVFGWITALAVIPNGSDGTDLFAATNVDGIWRRPLSEMITTVEGHSTDVPKYYSLAQNYPNPFNPSTKIQFSIPHSAHVALTVLNVVGQVVATLVSEELDAGTYTRTWDATRSASGVYFCRLQAGDFMDTKKLVLVR